MSMLTIRASSLDAFEPCPRRFYYSNFRKDIPGIGQPAALLGTAVHAGIARFWENRMAGRFEPNESTDAALAALESELRARPYDGVDRSKTWARTAFLSVWYAMGHENTEDQPLSVEMEVMGNPIEGVVLTGHPDLILKDHKADHHKLKVVDHKLRKEPMSAAMAGKLRQLTAYAFIYGLGWLKNAKGKIIDSMDCRIDNLHIGEMDKTMPSGAQGLPEMREIPTVRTLDDVDEMKQFLKQVAVRGDRVENYPTCPTNLCKACGFRAVCGSGQAFLRARNIPLYHDIASIRETDAA